MKCPFCNIEINPQFKKSFIGQDDKGNWFHSSMKCQNEKCQKLIINLECYTDQESMIPFGAIPKGNMIVKYYAKPIISSRDPIPKEVGEPFSEDYREACLILNLSPKASAALSRRCLQNILIHKAGVTKKDLSNQIQEVIDSGKLPSYLSENIDAIRNIGNFAAHPIKSSSTGVILPVEFGEAEWSLEVIESLFDFYFVQPEKMRLKREILDKKLLDAGKPPMK